MPRVISEAFPREDTNLHTSHTGTSHKESEHPHQHTTLDEKQTIFPRGGLKKHHDHHTQRDIEINTWAIQNNAKSHTFIPSEEQSEATTYPYHTNIESGKTFSHKHKFDRELDHRHPKNENTRQLYKWEDEQHRLKQSHGIDDKHQENDMVDKISQSNMDTQDTMTRQGLMDDKTNVQYPSDTVSALSISEYQHRMNRKQKSDQRQRLAAEQVERSQRDDVQHPQHAIPEPIISRADTQDDSVEMNRSGSERAMGSGISGSTLVHNERVNKSESSRM